MLFPDLSLESDMAVEPGSQPQPFSGAPDPSAPELEAGLTEEQAVQVRDSLREGARRCRERGLYQAAQWAAEQLVTVVADATVATAMDVGSSAGTILIESAEHVEVEPILSYEEEDACSLALSHFHRREYKRTAQLLRTPYGPNGEKPDPRSGYSSMRSLFLRLYATFLDGEQTVATQNLASDVMVQPHAQNPRLREILSELNQREEELDSFCLYLQGVVYIRLPVVRKARDALLRSLQKNPYNWSAWEEIAKIPASAEAAMALLRELPDGFMQKWFHLHMMATRKLLADHFTPAVSSLENMFGNSLRLILLSAVCYFHQGKYRPALLNFELYRSRNPVSLEYADLHSHVLFVLSETAKLSRLAHQCHKLDRYTAETQIVLANFFSMRRDHVQAVQAIQRALRLRPRQAQTLIMLGDEYLELKNANAALEAYRRAADAAPNEFRTWFGIAKSFDSLDMPEQAVPYLQKASACDQYRAQIWTMMGQAYEHSERHELDTGKAESALMCYKRALLCEDRSALVIYYIATLLERLGNKGVGTEKDERHNQAAFYYKVWIKEYDAGNVNQQNFVDEKENAISFLTQHYFRRKEFKKAEEYAVMIQHMERGKSLLREIRNRLEASNQLNFTSNDTNATPAMLPPRNPSEHALPHDTTPTSTRLPPPPPSLYNTRAGGRSSASANNGGGGSSAQSQTLRALPLPGGGTGSHAQTLGSLPGESWATPFSAARRPTGRASERASRHGSMEAAGWDSPAVDEDVR
ncbi:Anaphase-promoting complex subunit 23 [Geranomyces variabilis]|uniref:Anaphase-promoting complex subunit 23 n=1 Tax=Geranomyces variabilis TaxID=109894 RepID=A0AAD5TKY6_9FUNG|nr:Anaphase-promoting complex subunit 23 [Geranomyces variabilis]